MTLTLKLYGQLRHLADSEETTIEADADTTVADALLRASATYGDAFRHILFDDAGHLRPSMMVLLNDAPIDKTAPPAVADGDVVTVLPAIAGG